MNKIPSTHVYAYLLSGKVHATFHNTVTGNQLHVYIKQKSVGIWYVYYNNEYLGHIRGDLFIKDERITKLAPSILLAAQQFNWVWKQVVGKTLPTTMDVMHDGTCGCCRRQLTDSTSLLIGIGPSCRKKLGINYSPNQLELV